MESLIIKAIELALKYGGPEVLVTIGAILASTWFLSRRIKHAADHKNIYENLEALKTQLRITHQHLLDVQKDITSRLELYNKTANEQHAHLIEVLHNLDKELSRIQGQLHAVEKMLDTLEV